MWGGGRMFLKRFLNSQAGGMSSIEMYIKMGMLDISRAISPHMLV